MRVELTEGDVGAVAAQHLRLRHRRQVAHLVAVAEDELSSLDGRALAGQAGKDAAFDQGVADAVPVAQVRAHTRQHADLQLPDDRHAGQVVLAAANEVDPGLKVALPAADGAQQHVHVGGAEGLLPVGGGALADVAE